MLIKYINDIKLENMYYDEDFTEEFYTSEDYKNILKHPRAYPNLTDIYWKGQYNNTY